MLDMILIGMNNMRTLLLILIILTSACASLTQVKTEITDPEGKIWLVTSKSDAYIEIKRPDGTMVKVDNRGGTGFFRAYMEYMLIRAAPTVHVGERKGDED